MVLLYFYINLFQNLKVYKVIRGQNIRKEYEIGNGIGFGLLLFFSFPKVLLLLV